MRIIPSPPAVPPPATAGRLAEDAAAGFGPGFPGAGIITASTPGRGRLRKGGPGER